MLLFEEHINLDEKDEHGVGRGKQGEKDECARDEVLPWILSKHPNTLKSLPQFGKDGVLLAPFVVQPDKIDIQLEVISEPRQRFGITSSF